MIAANDCYGGIIFLDAPGGTGKTFLISLVLASIHAQSQIALAVASSGIAATLLERGQTAHSALKLPLNLQAIDDPTCNIVNKSAMAKVLQNCEISFGMSVRWRTNENRRHSIERSKSNRWPIAFI